MSANGPAIRLDKVSLSLGRTEVLRDINLRINAGEVHALVGPNGGGKSSLIKAVLGQMPHRGDIVMHWPDSIGKIGYVPHAEKAPPRLPAPALAVMSPELRVHTSTVR